MPAGASVPREPSLESTSLPVAPALSDAEFRLFQRFIYEAAGIVLSAEKKPLVCARLAQRLQAHGSSSYAAYFELLSNGQAPGEAGIAIDLLTTNETYFFREAKHFDLLRQIAQEARQRSHALRVWSAASSSGEEAYSIAMVLADCLNGAPWEVLGSDINARVLARARAGHYDMRRAERIPEEYLKRFCLKGVGAQQGTLLIERRLRARVQFLQLNLTESLPRIGTFDVIFLRNVMIYFDVATRNRLVRRLTSVLAPGGYLLIGHSEHLREVGPALERLAPAIYRRTFQRVPGEEGACR
jgi:chemotaxis protein methyltransferase CheR